MAQRTDSQRDKACQECGTAFPWQPGNRRYCSPACGRTAHLRSRRDREYRPAVRFCDQCGEQIEYKSGKRRYCSKECQTAGIAKEARWRVKGIDPALVDALALSCALCGATDRRLDIDHDHTCCPAVRACGKCFRGMLCRPCNVALGMFKESPALLRRAALYIENGASGLPHAHIHTIDPVPEESYRG